MIEEYKAQLQTLRDARTQLKNSSHICYQNGCELTFVDRLKEMVIAIEKQLAITEHKMAFELVSVEQPEEPVKLEEVSQKQRSRAKNKDKRVSDELSW